MFTTIVLSIASADESVATVRETSIQRMRMQSLSKNDANIRGRFKLQIKRKKEKNLKERFFWTQPICYSMNVSLQPNGQQ